MWSMSTSTSFNAGKALSTLEDLKIILNALIIDSVLFLSVNEANLSKVNFLSVEQI